MTGFVRLRYGSVHGRYLSVCDTDLFTDDIDTGNALRHGMFNLQAGIHFHKKEIFIGIHQELDGAGILVADGLSRLDSIVTE
jgi:hypothetical protein